MCPNRSSWARRDIDLTHPPTTFQTGIHAREKARRRRERHALRPAHPVMHPLALKTDTARQFRLTEPFFPTPNFEHPMHFAPDDTLQLACDILLQPSLTHCLQIPL